MIKKKFYLGRELLFILTHPVVDSFYYYFLFFKHVLYNISYTPLHAFHLRRLGLLPPITFVNKP